MLNTAYRTLCSPVLRAEYLLSRTGRAIQEVDQIEDQALIMEVMEAREEVDDAATEDDMEGIRERNQSQCFRIRVQSSWKSAEASRAHEQDECHRR